MDSKKDEIEDFGASDCSSSLRWSVTVSVNGEDILTISESHICGKDPISDLEVDTIRKIAESLKGFSGGTTKPLPLCAVCREPLIEGDQIEENHVIKNGELQYIELMHRRCCDESIVHRLSWSQVRDRMKAGEPLRWLPITDTPGQKRAVFIGNDRLDNDSSLEVHRAEARRELLVEPATAFVNGFVEAFVGTLR